MRRRVRAQRIRVQAVLLLVCAGSARRTISGNRSGSSRSRSARGATGKKRVHIFWQRRINDGDDTTPYGIRVRRTAARSARIGSCSRSRPARIGRMCRPSRSRLRRWRSNPHSSKRAAKRVRKPVICDATPKPMNETRDCIRPTDTGLARKLKPQCIAKTKGEARPATRRQGPRAARPSTWSRLTTDCASVLRGEYAVGRVLDVNPARAGSGDGSAPLRLIAYSPPSSTAQGRSPRAGLLPVRFLPRDLVEI